MISPPRVRSLTVFFPAYNDAPSIGALVVRAFEVLERHTDDYEVVVVNDGSRDNTGDVLARLKNRYGAKLRIVTHARNRGYGGALRSGFQAACKDLVFYTDGDGQYDISELPNLLTRMRPEVGLVNGFKLERHDSPHRIWIGKTYNWLARSIFRIRIRDIDCDYRLIRRALLERIELTCTSGTVCVELIRKLELSGYAIEEVGVHHYARLYGRSQFFRVRSLAVTFWQLLRLYLQLNVAQRFRRKAPLGPNVPIV
jgi:glycosyltransferase involved in cell wall biosynthesis